MRRRRGHSNAVDLFAFQDIMASVIGILFLIVLLMALDIVTDKASASGRRSETIPALREKARKLAAEGISINKEIENSTRKLVSLFGPENILIDIEQLNTMLLNIYAATEAGSASLEQLGRENSRMASKLKEKQNRLQGLNTQIAALKAKLQDGRAAPGLAFIIDKTGDHMEPWLVEVTAASIRVATKDGTASVTEFRAKEGKQRKKQFLGWARGQNKKTHYFVFLAKPSGVRTAEALLFAVKADGFDVGLDLLPEEWHAF